jgi:hypothetical protein
MTGLVVLAAVAGCGGTSSSTSDAAFRAKVQAICRVKTTEERAVGTPTSPADASRKVAAVAAIVERFSSRLAGIAPPPGKQPPYSQLLDTLNRQAHAVVALREVAKGGNQQRLQAVFGQLEAAGLASRHAAKELPGLSTGACSFPKLGSSSL